MDWFLKRIIVALVNVSFLFYLWILERIIGIGACYSLTRPKKATDTHLDTVEADIAQVKESRKKMKEEIQKINVVMSRTQGENAAMFQQITQTMTEKFMGFQSSTVHRKEISEKNQSSLRPSAYVPEAKTTPQITTAPSNQVLQILHY